MAYRNSHTSEQTYSLDEAAQILSRSRSEIERLIRQRRLGFDMSEFGPVITNSHMSNYLLGNRPHSSPEYKSDALVRKKRKQYARARTRR